MSGGISGDRDYVSIPVRASNDFTNPDKIGRAVTRGGEFADTGLEMFGVCMESASSGQMMKVGVWGLLKYRPIDIVSAGMLLTVTTSGFFTTVASAQFQVGRALAASGLDFANVLSNALGTGWIDGMSATFTFPNSSTQLFGV